jgi:hypothetical protein
MTSTKKHHASHTAPSADAFAPFLPEVGVALFRDLRAMDDRIAALEVALEDARQRRTTALRDLEDEVRRHWTADDIDRAQQAALLARDGLVDCRWCEMNSHRAIPCPACGREPEQADTNGARAGRTPPSAGSTISLCPDDAHLLTSDSLRTPEQDECGSPGPQSLCCTREAGHAGPHVAHVNDEPVALWLSVSLPD